MEYLLEKAGRVDDPMVTLSNLILYQDRQSPLNTNLIKDNINQLFNKEGLDSKVVYIHRMDTNQLIQSRIQTLVSLDLWNEFQIKEGIPNLAIQIFPTTRNFINNYQELREQIIQNVVALKKKEIPCNFILICFSNLLGLFYIQ